MAATGNTNQNQKQELHVVAMFANRSGQMSNLHRGHSIDASYQVSVVAIAHFVRSVNKHGHHRNLVGIIYGMSSMKITHFVPIG
jgi:hypothetical protein